MNTNDANAPGGATVLLDDVRFEPVPDAQGDALSFPLGNETFGVIPLQEESLGRVPLPPDQVLRNLTTIYESAIAGFALLKRRTPEDLENARRIADAFHQALHHDNSGDPLPVAPDGSTGLHSGYSSGDLWLRNDQGPGPGQVGEVRLAGFSAELCGATGFCLVLDGATGGNNAFAILALIDAYETFGDVTYLEDARTIARWIAANLRDETGTGFGGCERTDLNPCTSCTRASLLLRGGFAMSGLDTGFLPGGTRGGGSRNPKGTQKTTRRVRGLCPGPETRHGCLPAASGQDLAEIFLEGTECR